MASIHLLIIDALNLIRRIHAVQGSPCKLACRHAVEQLLQHTQPTHVVAVFDGEHRGQSWRYKLFSGYKSGRKPMPDTLACELPSIRQELKCIGVSCWQFPCHEADDITATLANKVTALGHQITIISTNKSYCQLLAPRLCIRDYFQKRWLDFSFVQKEFSIRPDQLPDYWALVGINNSNLVGVVGIGPKSASTLLTEYETLDKLYTHLPEIAEKWRRKLESQKKQAYLNRDIATLRTDLILEKNLLQLKINNIKQKATP